MKKVYLLLAFAACFVIITLVLPGCDSSTPTSANPPPAGHTVNKGGVYHAPDLCNPFPACTECHGENLQGGSDGEPSCTRCHGEKWNNC